MNGRSTSGLFRAEWMLGMVFFSLWLCGCRRQETPRLPPPVYEKPTLPRWEPAPDDQEAAPFDFEGMEGETVEDDEEDADDEQASEPLPQTPLSEGKPDRQTESDADSGANSKSGANRQREAENKNEDGAQ